MIQLAGGIRIAVSSPFILDLLQSIYDTYHLAAMLPLALAVRVVRFTREPPSPCLCCSPNYGYDPFEGSISIAWRVKMTMW